VRIDAGLEHTSAAHYPLRQEDAEAPKFFRSDAEEGRVCHLDPLSLPEHLANHSGLHEPG